MKTISPESIKSFLKGVCIPQIRIVECDSTNTYSKSNWVEEDTIYIALTQSGGHGRDGRKFLSNSGGIYMSVVLKREIDYDFATRYPLFCGVAVREALLRQGVKSDIKWPNDVLVNGKKICGVLCEFNKEKQNIILGVGINVDNDLGEFDDIATSTKKLGVDADINNIIADVYQAISYCEKMKFIDFLDDYRAACITVGSFVPGIGKAVGIDKDGFLTVLNGSGELITVYNPSLV